jgi:hypothetical protein
LLGQRFLDLPHQFSRRTPFALKKPQAIPEADDFSFFLDFHGVHLNRALHPNRRQCERKENVFQALPKARNRDPERDEPLSSGFYSKSKVHMTQAQHYRFQADQANRLAAQVSNSDVRQRLLEMAGEYSRYAELMEAREHQVF